MNPRENLMSLIRRNGYVEVPVEMELCPFQIEKYKQVTKSNLSYNEYFQFPEDCAAEPILRDTNKNRFSQFYEDQLKPETVIDPWGVAHEPGSKEAMHMTRMIHPLRGVDSFEKLSSYPFPDFSTAKTEHIKASVTAIKNKGLAAVAQMQCTIWETAWYIRSMEDLMIDMLSGDDKAVFILDNVTKQHLYKAKAFVNAGVDILYLGDDIGMQNSIMMSEELYIEWIKPRLKSLITEVKKINPELIIFYHTCGYVIPLIPHLIDAGIDVLNPVQPECMDFEDIYRDFGNKLSFSGAIGTQKLMPFGSPEDIRKEVFKLLDIAGPQGGLFVSPSHMLEPDVPWKNIIAYVEACRDYIK